MFKIFTNPIGVFLTSLVANSIPFVAVPYLLLVLAYSLTLHDLVSKLVVAFASAVGATIGKVMIYFIGSFIRLRLSDKVIRNLELFNKVADKSAFVAIFLFASLPLPDDVLYIPLGMSRYNFTRYFVAVLVGKSLMTTAVVLYGHMLSALMSESLILLPLYIALTALLSYTVVKVNWSAVLESLNDRGVKEAVLELLRQVLRAYRIRTP